MRHYLVLILLPVVLAAGTGCRPSPPETEQSPARASYRARCQSCHRLPEPTEKTANQWREWLAEHREQAGLDERQFQEMVDYLVSASSR